MRVPQISFEVSKNPFGVQKYLEVWYAVYTSTSKIYSRGQNYIVEKRNDVNKSSVNLTVTAFEKHENMIIVIFKCKVLGLLSVWNFELT